MKVTKKTLKNDYAYFAALTKPNNGIFLNHSFSPWNIIHMKEILNNQGYYLRDNGKFLVSKKQFIGKKNVHSIYVSIKDLGDGTYKLFFNYSKMPKQS